LAKLSSGGNFSRDALSAFCIMPEDSDSTLTGFCRSSAVVIAMCLRCVKRQQRQESTQIDLFISMANGYSSASPISGDE
jgi:hypothetical protein